MIAWVPKPGRPLWVCDVNSSVCTNRIARSRHNLLTVTDVHQARYVEMPRVARDPGSVACSPKPVTRNRNRNPVVRSPLLLERSILFTAKLMMTAVEQGMQGRAKTSY